MVSEALAGRLDGGVGRAALSISFRFFGNREKLYTAGASWWNYPIAHLYKETQNVDRVC